LFTIGMFFVRQSFFSSSNVLAFLLSNG